ncbi:unnamed protein product [Heterobilharzia americana]|nr:unnamed protein product [Heterobilharzia americana]
MRRYVKPPSTHRNVLKFQIPEKPQENDSVNRAKPDLESVHTENLIRPTAIKSKRIIETVTSVEESTVKPLILKKSNSVSTDTIDMDIEDHLRCKSLEKENTILEQQKDIAEVKTLVFYLSEQLMLAKCIDYSETFNATKDESHQQHQRRRQQEQEQLLQQDQQQQPQQQLQRAEHHLEQSQKHQQQPITNEIPSRESHQDNISQKTFSDKYTETSEPLSLNTIPSTIGTQDIHRPKNLDATLVTLDNTWLVSWSNPESVDSNETVFSSIVGYVISVNGIEVKRIPSVNLNKAIINLSESVRYPVALQVQSIDENNYLSRPALITLNA